MLCRWAGQAAPVTYCAGVVLCARDRHMFGLTPTVPDSTRHPDTPTGPTGPTGPTQPDTARQCTHMVTVKEPPTAPDSRPRHSTSVSGLSSRQWPDSGPTVARQRPTGPDTPTVRTQALPRKRITSSVPVLIPCCFAMSRKPDFQPAAQRQLGGLRTILRSLHPQTCAGSDIP